jgi:peptidoglycan/xylan/chitin deacetylase (PgdA/CDA1 family)
VITFGKIYLILLFFVCFQIIAQPAYASSSDICEANKKNELQRKELDESKNIYSHGGIIRTDTTKKEINLVFTAHEFADGFETITKTLNGNDVKASFFFTGDFYRNKDFEDMIFNLKDYGHYLGAHSDKHLLYASWENRDSTIITKEEFRKDVLDNYTEMGKFGIQKTDASYFLPPYEWYNSEISEWCREIGLTIINFTPGTYSNQDWTIPEMGERYFSNDFIYNKILSYEESSSCGLNGFILLIHFGTDPRREEKFYNRLDELITELKKRGYTFRRLDNI